MIGFHIDMNMAQHSAAYLRKWLPELARRGYDTILWEVENNIAWRTCRECVSPDAFSKKEFRALLAESRLQGLEPVPLLQTIGHAEYVLEHEKYAHLREVPDRIDQYCPRNSKLLPFLHKWISEYLEVFGDVKYFHIGADESMQLGACASCKTYAEEYSLSRLYIEHVNAVGRFLTKRGITPIVWADMLLACNDALDMLSRDITLFDWRYDIYRGSGKVCIWSKGVRREGDRLIFSDAMTRKEEFTPEFKERFGKYLYPGGERAESEPETFYTADFLADRGFKVVTCPASSHYGDNVFSPRDRLHTANVFDSFHKGRSEYVCGSMLTSWSVHLHPWEVQLAYIAIPAFVRDEPHGTVEQFREGFAKEAFGINAVSFWEACDLLSRGCLFTYTSSLGFGKSCHPVAEDHVPRKLAELRGRSGIDEEIQNCEARLGDYNNALEIIRAMEQLVTRGQDLLKVWKLAARNLVNRAETSLLLLQNADSVISGRALDAEGAQKVRIVLGKLRGLRKETKAMYTKMIRPTRRDEMVAYMFEAVEKALASLAG